MNSNKIYVFADVLILRYKDIDTMLPTGDGIHATEVFFCLLVTWLVSLLIHVFLTKFGTTELEGKLGLLTILCSLWIRSWVTVNVVDTHRPTCLPKMLSGHLRCMSVHLGRVKHNSVSLRTDVSKVFPLWMSADELC